MTGSQAFALLIVVVFFVGWALIITACSPPGEEATIIINDNPNKVYFKSFRIWCDKEKRLALASVDTSQERQDSSKYAVAGAVPYDEWCEGAE